MNEEYLMRTGDTFIARECGCAMTVISGPVAASSAVCLPKCCCGHEMIKESQLMAGADMSPLTRDEKLVVLLPGMLE